MPKQSLTNWFLTTGYGDYLVTVSYHLFQYGDVYGDSYYVKFNQLYNAKRTLAARKGKVITRLPTNRNIPTNDLPTDYF
jgi:hypothetical protein